MTLSQEIQHPFQRFQRRQHRLVRWYLTTQRAASSVTAFSRRDDPSLGELTCSFTLGCSCDRCVAFQNIERKLYFFLNDFKRTGQKGSDYVDVVMEIYCRTVLRVRPQSRLGHPTAVLTFVLPRRVLRTDDRVSATSDWVDV